MNGSLDYLVNNLSKKCLYNKYKHCKKCEEYKRCEEYKTDTVH